MAFFVILIAATWAFPDSGIVEHVVLPPVMWAQQIFAGIADTVARMIAG